MQGLYYFLVSRLFPGIVTGWLVVALLHRESAVWLVKEDRLIEWLQFFFVMMSALYCLKIVRNYKHRYDSKPIRYVFSLLLVLLTVLALEEINWGQRIFGFETPAFIASINVQKQISLHNFVYFQRFRHWLMILFGIIGILLIQAGEKRDDSGEKSMLMFFAPPAFFTLAFSLIIFSGIILEAAIVLKPVLKSMAYAKLARVFRFWAGRFSEIGEFGVAITAFSYTGMKYRWIRNMQKDLSS
jgi:hypothetical protein